MLCVKADLSAAMVTMIIADSSVWIDHFKDRTSERVTYLRRAIERGEVVVGDVIMLELLQGVGDDRRAENLERTLRIFPVLEMMNLEIAMAAARNFRHLRDTGITIRRTIDLIIATFCIERGYALLHNDRDFLPFVEKLGLMVPDAS